MMIVSYIVVVTDCCESGGTVAGATPKQALAYPTQHSFLSQMWRTLVA